MHETLNLLPTQPLYLYQQPMFSLTVSVVLIVENGVIVVEKDGKYMFPNGMVRAGQETIQFSAVRYVKEQVGLLLKRDSLIPVDFRSDPERSDTKNIVDIGFLSMLTDYSPEDISKIGKTGARWQEIDFENKSMINRVNFYMDHSTLLERAIMVAVMMK